MDVYLSDGAVMFAESDAAPTGNNNCCNYAYWRCGTSKEWSRDAHHKVWGLEWTALLWS